VTSHIVLDRPPFRFSLAKLTCTGMEISSTPPRSEIGSQIIVQVQGRETLCQYCRAAHGGLEMRDIRGPGDHLSSWTRVPWLTLVWMRFRRRKWNLIVPAGSVRMKDSCGEDLNLRPLGYEGKLTAHRNQRKPTPANNGGSSAFRRLHGLGCFRLVFEHRTGTVRPSHD